MGQLDVHIRHGGGGVSVAALVPVAGCVLLGAAVVVTARAAASIPVWVFAAIPVGIVAGVVAAAVAVCRHNRRRAADMAALFEARRAGEAVAKAARVALEREHQLAVTAAQAPVIHNHIWPSAEAAHAVMDRGYTPTTVFTHQQQEIGQ